MVGFKAEMGCLGDGGVGGSAWLLRYDLFLGIEGP